MVELQYENHEHPRVPTLSVAPELLRLAMPPPPFWLEIGSLAFWCAMTCAQFIGFGYMVLAMVRFRMSLGPFPVDKGTMASLAAEVAVLMMMVVLSVALLYDRCRTGAVPRVLEISGGTLRQSRRGMWGIRRLSWPVARISQVHLKPIKGLLGKQVGVLLVLKLGRWCRIRIQFGRKWLDLAAEAERGSRKPPVCRAGIARHLLRP